eukprot:CAMPEP_0181307288 /NCGR_PEP_ID=MMETSP1101-20121128/10788_1 /TAXON_ID=46948 /ORGANISM="Rhodomonas abbreviata, Strain Caron Lab Isolate" /LENGTH=132 /DNA_ID=CAMNT_0023413471 /DNA_START=87 /DNA_END=484 /DNA_ORIENTATION=+
MSISSRPSSGVAQSARVVEPQIQQTTNVQRAVAVGLAHGKLYDLALSPSLVGFDDLTIQQVSKPAVSVGLVPEVVSAAVAYASSSSSLSVSSSVAALTGGIVEREFAVIEDRVVQPDGAFQAKRPQPHRRSG